MASGAAPAADGRCAALSCSSVASSTGTLPSLRRFDSVAMNSNSLGIVSYAQIADWTTVDIDRVSASLDFKGRIERENWVEQARILAAGGQTEFSRRVDRGEVETSKSR